MNMCFSVSMVSLLDQASGCGPVCRGGSSPQPKGQRTTASVCTVWVPKPSERSGRRPAVRRGAPSPLQGQLISPDAQLFLERTLIRKNLEGNLGTGNMFCFCNCSLALPAYATSAQSPFSATSGFVLTVCDFSGGFSY